MSLTETMQQVRRFIENTLKDNPDMVAEDVINLEVRRIAVNTANHIKRPGSKHNGTHVELLTAASIVERKMYQEHK